MRVSSSQRSINFNAIPLAQWRCKALNNKTKNITIIAFEKKDINFVEKFVEKSDLICSKDSLKQELVNDTIRTIRDALGMSYKSFEKIKMFMAIHEGTPCGLLVGNVPKKNIDTEQIKYSSRHNPAKNETELDWLVTWEPKIGEKIKELRTEHNLSQMQLAKIINVSQKAIDYWERSVNEPKASYIIALVRAFGITFDEFFSDIN